MRLPIVSHGHRLREKLILLVIRITRGSRAPDIVRTLFYRPELFGKTMSAWTQAVMRGPSTWTVADRELFAAFTSALNHCPF